MRQGNETQGEQERHAPSDARGQSGSPRGPGDAATPPPFRADLLTQAASQYFEGEPAAPGACPSG
jgi:hypothetical protein